MKQLTFVRPRPNDVKGGFRIESGDGKAGGEESQMSTDGLEKTPTVSSHLFSELSCSDKVLSPGDRRPSSIST